MEEHKCYPKIQWSPYQGLSQQQIRIAKLNEENNQLKEQINILNGRLQTSEQKKNDNDYFTTIFK